MRQHHVSGLKLATWLERRPEVDRVLHPGLPTHPQHDIWKRDFYGACGLFGIVLKPVNEEAIASMLDGLKLYGMGASWGGFESLILLTNPAATRTVAKEKWENDGPTLRIHVGLEDIDDLIADLEEGFKRLNAKR